MHTLSTCQLLLAIHGLTEAVLRVEKATDQDELNRALELREDRERIVTDMATDIGGDKYAEILLHYALLIPTLVRDACGGRHILPPFDQSEDGRELHDRDHSWLEV